MSTTSRAALLSAVALAAIAGSPVGAAAATAPPTITSAFTPSLVGAGGTTSLSFTIANPNPSTTLSSVALTDTLPPNVTVDDPNGENGTCGSASVVTATAGSSTISLSGGSLKAGTSCTLSVAVTASRPETVQNQTGDVSSSAGSSTHGDTETLTVLPAPTVTVGKPRDNAKYTYGEVVRAGYSCAQPGDATGLSDCSAQDDLGNTINSGGRLDTRSPGRHTLSISALGVDGLVTTDTIHYTVLPDNRFLLSRVKALAGGALRLVLALPGAGKVRVRELAGVQTLASTASSVDRKRRLTVTLAPAGSGGPRIVTLEVSYTPTGGHKRTVVRHGISVS